MGRHSNVIKPVKDFSYMPPRRQAVNQNHMTQEQIKVSQDLRVSGNRPQGKGANSNSKYEAVNQDENESNASFGQKFPTE